MLERLISSVGATHIDRTLHIAAAYASHKDPLPGLAITTMAKFDAVGPNACVEYTELLYLLHKRVSKKRRASMDQVNRAIIWWLANCCDVCYGTKLIVIDDKPVQCYGCGGSGKMAHIDPSDAYGMALMLLDSSYEWARRVAVCMPMAYDVRVTAEVA